MDKERWKDIKGYEGYYQISDMGRVKSIERIIESGQHYLTERKNKEIILKQSLSKCGYPQICLQKNGIKKTLTTHRLILNTFIGDSDLECNHKDGNKQNNKLENLEWVTQSENEKHAYRTGLKSKRGEKNCFAKLTQKAVMDIRGKIKDKENTKKYRTIIADSYNVTERTISRIVNNENWI